MPPDERARVEAHLAECEDCSAYLEDMRRLVGSLNATVGPPPDPETREALLRAFRERQGA
jgi:anti-sigma factor RsiW